jgi:hypothetical protein
MLELIVVYHTWSGDRLVEVEVDLDTKRPRRRRRSIQFDRLSWLYHLYLIPDLLSQSDIYVTDPNLPLTFELAIHATRRW